MATNAAHIMFFLSAMVGAHPHHDHEDHGRMLAMPDGTYVCPVCGFVYDPAVIGTPFASQSDSYACPVCTQPKKGFTAWDAAWDAKPLCLNATHNNVNGEVTANSNTTCATCANHAKAGVQCLPAYQGGMDKYYQEPAAGDGGKMVATGDGKYVCSVCGYVYDPAVSGKAFSAEPDTFACPVCTQPKKGFNAWTTADDSKLLCLNASSHKMGNGMVMANSEMDPNPCATCENHGKAGVQCLPSGQGGMDNFVGEAPPAPAPAPAAAGTAAPTTTAGADASGSLGSNVFSLTGACILVLALSL